MDCPEFLDSYSEFRDGRITDPSRLGRLCQHLYTCTPCARYDACLREGVRALRDAREIDPSPGFAARLRARVTAAAGQATEPVSPQAAGIAAALVLAAAVALLLYEGRRWDGVRGETGAATTAPKSLPLVVANPGVPFVTFTDLSVSPFQNGAAASPVHAAGDGVPLGSWANLPR